MDMLFTLDPRMAWIASTWLAALFAHAALVKLADIALFEQHLAAYRLPHALLPGARWAVPALELLAAALLLVGPWRAQAAGLAATLLLGYAALMGWHRLHGRALDCGCGGEPLPVSWLLVARNLLLAVLAAVAALPGTAGAMGAADFALVAAALPLAALLYAAAHQLLLRQAGHSTHRSSIFTSSRRT